MIRVVKYFVKNYDEEPLCQCDKSGRVIHLGTHSAKRREVLLILYIEVGAITTSSRPAAILITAFFI